MRIPVISASRRTRTTSTIAATAAVLTTALVLTGCSSKGADSQLTPDAGYPDAPEQHVPVAVAVDGPEITDTPIAQLPDPEWVGATAAELGIPARALAAYAGASIRLSVTSPDCGLGWNTLAGIGEVESMHGSYGGSALDGDGLVDPPIIGIPLDGGPGVMEIPDTDNGELDGDNEWDRAVGPMQFIPETWDWIGQDGNMDGVADPQNIDDAALSAADMLCRTSGETVTDTGWNEAVTTYNRSVQYARDVAGHATRYLEDLP